ncbi:hypothetical protein BOTBODRAFT_113863 [Botryobasidium botryosum FD-172 SS1]|uniref:Methyltransferase domain-containing protein n=1 Tax=Botryobasidium botryosum (strain FD-172 SS1) TaxID=930990 RepID=A0A067MJM1_BOTB1|nr:hypothetical protein BOTBODRAFT_113863 [Botryobasidium botryosum FD-172 SS1]
MTWDKAWFTNLTPWDRGAIQPPLRELFESDAIKLDLPKSGRALVPGCGRGYDALYLASRGYQTLGLDLSPKAIALAKEHQASQYPDSLSYIADDFFKFDYGSPFDIVYDWTFFCAFPREMRPAWGKRMGEIVAPGGLLIALAFPIDGRDAQDGPPFSVDVGSYKESLGEGWEKVLDHEPATAAEQIRNIQRLVVWKRAK